MNTRHDSPRPAETPGTGTPAPGALALLEREAGSALGDPRPDDLSFVFVDSWRRDLSSVTAAVFRSSEPEPALYAKVGSGGARASLRVQHDNLGALARSADTELRQSVPRVLRFVETDELTLLLQSVVGGRKPLAVPDELLADRVVSWLVRFHEGTHRDSSPIAASAVHELLQAPIERYVRDFEPSGTERRFLDDALLAAGRLAGIALPRVYQHSDFCRQNLLVDGTRLAVLDWDVPFRPSLPAFDLFHFLACLGVERCGDELEAFEDTFFAGGRLAPLARASIRRYAEEAAIPLDSLRPIFTAFWTDYACNRKQVLTESSGNDGTGERDEPDWWTLAVLDGTCANVRMLAERGDRLVLPNGPRTSE